MRPMNTNPLFSRRILIVVAAILVVSGLNAQNSLNRNLDPVVVVGDSMPKLLGVPVGSLKVLVYEAASGLWHPIPSQVDEVLPNGDYFGDTNGTLDPKDELVFMAQDMGDQAPDDQAWWADEDSKQSPRYEIAVTNPNTEEKAYAYAYSSPVELGVPPNYVSIRQDTVFGGTYIMAHHPNIASGLPDFLSIPVPGVQDSSLDILNRHRFRLELIFKYGGATLGPIVIKERMNNWEIFPGVRANVFQKRPADVVEGPVRIKRRTVLGLSAKGSILGTDIDESDSLKITYTYYSTYSELWSEAREIPKIQPSDIEVRLSKVLLSQTLNPNGFGMIYHNRKTMSNAAGPVRINDSDHPLPNDKFYPDDNVAWPGKHWYAEVANSNPTWVDPSTGKKAILSKATLFTILELRGAPVCDQQAIFLKEYDHDDAADLAEQTSYGDAGLRMIADNNNSVNGVLDVLVKNYYFAKNYTSDSLQMLFDEYSVPLVLNFVDQVNDHIPPAVIEDLAVIDVGDTTATLTWTAPGDDGNSGGKAARYLIRYNTEPMGADIWAWWGAATNIAEPPTPGDPGSTEQFIVGNLQRNTQYYFCMRAGDEVIYWPPTDVGDPGWSPLSNVASGSTTVPVELASFVANSVEDKVSLQWTTASETNNLGFAVERKRSNEDGWQEIAFVRGAGSTSTPHQYAYQDAPNFVGGVSYRLRQVDTDGAFSYSKVVEVTMQAPSQFVLEQNFPNPFNPSTTIAYQIPASAQGRMSLTIYDMLGRQVRTLFEEPAKAGYYRAEWDGRDDNGLVVSSGIYFYILRSGTFQATRKMIKLE